MRNSCNGSKTNGEKKENMCKSDYFTTKVNRCRHTKRLCLRCGKKFPSKGFHNRICMKCELINERQGKVNYNYLSLVFPEVTEFTEIFR